MYKFIFAIILKTHILVFFLLCLEVLRFRLESVHFLSGLDMDLMKERFAKLLLGEDMSGGGRGVSSALALSNAITNLAGKFDSFHFFWKGNVLNLNLFLFCCSLGNF